jgi:hypothetical protein
VTFDTLVDPPPPELFRALQHKGVSPLAAGHVIVATWTPNETKVLEAIKEIGLELQVTFNKGAVMVLPTGVNRGLAYRPHSRRPRHVRRTTCVAIGGR